MIMIMSLSLIKATLDCHVIFNIPPFFLAISEAYSCLLNQVQSGVKFDSFLNRIRFESLLKKHKNLCGFSIKNLEST